MAYGLVGGAINSLFCNTDWHSCERTQIDAMQKEINQYDPDALLNASVDDLVAYFVSEFEIDVPVLLSDQITLAQRETTFEQEDYGRTIRVNGILIEVDVPFTGDAAMFSVQPTSFSFTNQPSATIQAQSLLFSISGSELDSGSAQDKIDSTLSEIQEHLERLRASAVALNTQLTTAARERVEYRKDKLLADQNLVANLGYPLKSGASEQKTYAAPEIKKKITPKPPKPGIQPFEPEPAIALADYENILSIMERMVGVMERSPRDFTHMGEETLRSHFLVQLNSQYEGQATGETFNYEGKTDILIKSNGRNLFVAECKFWKGAKNHAKTIDQLLGYLSWRDTMAAIVVFNRNKNFSKMLVELEKATTLHPNCKELLRKRSESGLVFRFVHRDDPNREMTVAVLAFDVPRLEC